MVTADAPSGPEMGKGDVGGPDRALDTSAPPVDGGASDAADAASSPADAIADAAVDGANADAVPADASVEDGAAEAGAADGSADASSVDGGEAGSSSALRASCSLVFDMEEAAWNGTAGEVRDSCGSHNGTAVGPTLPKTVPGGHFGRAGSFHTGGCVKVADNADLRSNTFTLSAWVMPDQGSDGMPLGIFSKRVDYQMDSQYTLFLFQQNTVYVDIGSARYQGSKPVPYDGHWHHVAAVFDGNMATGSLRIYVDGALDTAFDAGQTIPTIATPPPLYVGCLVLGSTPGPFDETFQGDIDEAAIWHRALGPDEIHALYQLGSPL